VEALQKLISSGKIDINSEEVKDTIRKNEEKIVSTFGKE